MCEKARVAEGSGRVAFVYICNESNSATTTTQGIFDTDLQSKPIFAGKFMFNP